MKEYYLTEEEVRKLTDSFAALHDLAIKLIREREMLGRTNRWIPCKERLPDNYETVLMTDIDGSVMLGYRNAEGRWRELGYDDYAKNIVAWRILPEAYVEEGEKDE